MLIAVGLYFTVGTKFLQFRLIGEMFRVIREPKSKAKGSISPFQAFAISMAARVGTGNITGVALAISLGGRGRILDVDYCAYRFGVQFYREYAGPDL